MNVVLEEFNKLWNALEYTKHYDEFIDEYHRKYEEKRLFQKPWQSRKYCKE